VGSKAGINLELYQLVNESYKNYATLHLLVTLLNETIFIANIFNTLSLLFLQFSSGAQADMTSKSHQEGNESFNN
jgi:hypothetical protein